MNNNPIIITYSSLENLISPIKVIPRFVIDKMLSSRYRPCEFWNLISISSPGSLSSPPLNDSEKNMLRSLGMERLLQLEFDDVTDKDIQIAQEAKAKGNYNLHRDLVLFNSAQAAYVIDFLLQRDTHPLVVHCDAGISRSGAVGEVASIIFEIPYSKFMEDNPNVHPNSYMKSLLMRELTKRS